MRVPFCQPSTKQCRCSEPKSIPFGTTLALDNAPPFHWFRDAVGGAPYA
ncbi:hypothetical protein [Azospirillum doebereinerae]